jgi:hypothetical protein
MSKRGSRKRHTLPRPCKARKGTRQGRARKEHAFKGAIVRTGYYA